MSDDIAKLAKFWSYHFARQNCSDIDGVVISEREMHKIIRDLNETFSKQKFKKWTQSDLDALRNRLRQFKVHVRTNGEIEVTAKSRYLNKRFRKKSRQQRLKSLGLTQARYYGPKKLEGRCSIPPQLAERVLYLFLPKRAREHIPGDLEEEFNTVILPRHGIRYAKVWYWKQVLSSIWPVVTSRAAKLLRFAWTAKLAEWLAGKL